METRERLDEMVAVRMPGWERFALDQMADLTGANRSEVVRHAIAVAMREAMMKHPRFPVHPVWVHAGDDRWTISLYQNWACALVAANPIAHLDVVAFDGVTGYKPAFNEQTPKLHHWREHAEAHRARQATAGGAQ